MVPNPNDELDMSTKGNWSYFDSLEVIATQKYSNRFEIDSKKWTLLSVVTITFDPQRIFEWGLFHWKVDILDFNLNTNFDNLDLYWMSYGRLKLDHLSSQNYGFWRRMHGPTFAGQFLGAQNFIFFRAQSLPLWWGRPLDPSEHPKLSKWVWKPLV